MNKTFLKLALSITLVHCLSIGYASMNPNDQDHQNRSNQNKRELDDQSHSSNSNRTRIELTSTLLTTQSEEEQSKKNLEKYLKHLEKDTEHFSRHEHPFDVSSKEMSNEKFSNVSIKVQELQCVIDLGSSGVQLGYFRINNSQQIVEEQIFNKKVRLLLQAGIQNKVLPEEIQKQTVKVIKDLLAEANINPEHTKVYGFATAWARAAENSAQLIKAINSEAKVKIEIIDQQREGMFGLQATLEKLRSLMLNEQSFLYQTVAGKQIRSKLTGGKQENFILPQNIISWDIGGGSMQLARIQPEGTVHIIGSDDSSTIFANAVIDLKHEIDKTHGNILELPQNTPNPLSAELVDAVTNLAMERAKKFVDSSFLEHIKLKDTTIFGIGLMHKSNQSYINRLLKINLEHSYTKFHLKEAIKYLVDKSDHELATLLNVPVLEVRNRFTSMLLVLGFMNYFQVEAINTISVNIITGIFFSPQ